MEIETAIGNRNSGDKEVKVISKTICGSGHVGCTGRSPTYQCGYSSLNSVPHLRCSVGKLQLGTGQSSSRIGVFMR